MHVRTNLLLIRTLNGTYLVCCVMDRGLRCAVQFSRFNDIHTDDKPVHITAVPFFVAVYARIPHKGKVKNIGK